MRIEEIRKDIKSKIPQAVTITQDKVAKIVEDVLLEYYASYTPVEDGYDRTYQLLSSCVMEAIKVSGNGASARVYLDSGSMSYTSGSQPSGAQVMEAANAGVHGAAGLKTVGSGPPLSSTAEERVGSEINKILLDAIRAAGIPVR